MWRYSFGITFGKDMTRISADLPATLIEVLRVLSQSVLTNVYLTIRKV